MEKRLFQTSITLFFSITLITTVVSAQTKTVVSHSGYATPRQFFNNRLLKEAPQFMVSEREEYERALSRTHLPIPTRVDPTIDPRTIQPTSPETFPKIGGAENQSGGAQEPCSFRVFRNRGLTNAGSSTTNEPSFGVNGRVAFYSGNWYAAISGDAGLSFSFINPFDNFPADGNPDPVNGGFCCDQIVYYERTRGLLLWLLQYQDDGNTNTQRLAVARSQADVINNNWIVYDFTPDNFGFAASGFSLDFPDLSVSDNFLYFSTNVFTISTGQFSGAVVARFPLNEIARGQGLNYGYFSTPDFGTLRCTHGAHDIMWFASHRTTSMITIWRWPENSRAISQTDVSHDVYNQSDRGRMTAIDPGGRNFAAFADDRILGAWRANGVLGFMWNVAQGGGFAFPHVWVLQLRETNFDIVRQEQIWNSQIAWLYPSVHPNEREHVGGTIALGGGNIFPRAAAWIVDDCSSTFAPLENLTIANGNIGPDLNRWGDYLTTRWHVPYSNSWVGSGYALLGPGGGGGNNVDPRYVWFGRERDNPPQANMIVVDFRNEGGWEDSSPNHPYNTVKEGNFAAMPGDDIVIRAGNYSESVTFATRSIVRSEGGTVIIGPNTASNNPASSHNAPTKSQNE